MQKWKSQWECWICHLRTLNKNRQWKLLLLLLLIQQFLHTHLPFYVERRRIQSLEQKNDVCLCFLKDYNVSSSSSLSRLKSQIEKSNEIRHWRRSSRKCHSIMVNTLLLLFSVPIKSVIWSTRILRHRNDKFRQANIWPAFFFSLSCEIF